MNSKKIQSALHDAVEDEVPSTSIHLLPGVKADLAAGKAGHPRTTNPTLRRLAYPALAIAILLAVALLTPQGRGFAQRMFRFFSVTEEKSFPIPTEQVMPAPATPTTPATQVLALAPVLVKAPAPTPTPDATCSTPAARATYLCQVQAAEALAGFDAVEFQLDPKGLEFSAARYNPEIGEIDMEFAVATGGGYLHLRQGISEFPDTEDRWGQVPSDAVEQVSVNGNYAEIAQGSFVVYPNATRAVWEPGPGHLGLAWREGLHWFVIEKMGDPYPIEWITKDELVRLAEGLVQARPADAVAPLDPEYLNTVAQAEALAGFDIPEPALLPESYELKRVVWMYEVARLFYGPANSTQSELSLTMGRIADTSEVGPCLDCPAGVVETVQVGDNPGWYWRGIFESAAPSGQGEPTPVWNGEAASWSLVWNSDTFWYSLGYHPAQYSGKEMDRETLIEIAESIR